MKTLRQYKRENYGIALHTVQLEIPASKRVLCINDSEEDYANYFYLSLPKIGILASFFCQKNEVLSFVQYGFFVGDDNKTYPMVLPNVNFCFEIDSCSTGNYVSTLLSQAIKSGKENYSEIISNQFLTTGFELTAGANLSHCVRYGQRDKKTSSCSFDVEITNFYEEWEHKTKTIEG